jgi:hypothetical protein
MVLLNAVVIVGCGGLRPSCRVGTFAGASDSFAPTELSRGRQGDGLILSITQMGDGALTTCGDNFILGLRYQPEKCAASTKGGCMPGPFVCAAFSAIQQ